MSSVDPRWLAAALHPLQAFGPDLGPGTLRLRPEDFIVEEDLGFLPAGSGQHVLLKVRKRDANTQWVARELSRHCGCRPMDVGFAGLKDRRSVASQWFSVPASSVSTDAWLAVQRPEFVVLEAEAHNRKLPRGALAGNAFIIRVRDAQVAQQALAQRVEQIVVRGVPNYFGPQRFGRDAANLAVISSGLQGLRVPERGFVLSAARSLIFNAILSSRVADGSWEHLEPGELANLDGRGSVFAVAEVDSAIRERSRRLDVHPTGALWGEGLPEVRGRILELETAQADDLSEAAQLVRSAGMRQERRALRLAVRDFTFVQDEEGVVLRFRLTRGSFATTVIREIFSVEAAGQPDE